MTTILKEWFTYAGEEGEGLFLDPGPGVVNQHPQPIDKPGDGEGFDPGGEEPGGLWE